MRTIRTKIYKFEELNKDAQQKAVENLYDINVMFNWWENVYEDAANIGLKITGFDIDRGSYVNGDFNLSASEVAANIFRDYGESCSTYKTAAEFMEEWTPVFSKYMETEDGEDILMDIEERFLKSICEDYRIILKNEYEYLSSEDAIKETIESNGYEFKQDGTRY